MSAGNYFQTRKKAFDLRQKDITTSSTVTTYTAKVGTTANDLIVDRVINITTTSGNDMAITLPDGEYEGQRVLINFVTEGNNETVTVTPSTANTTASYSLTAAGDYCSLEWMNATEGWAYLSELTT